MGGKLIPPHWCWGNSSLLVVLGTQQMIAASDLRKETSISEEHGHLPLLPRTGQCRSRQVRTNHIPWGLKDEARLPLPLLLLVRPPTLLRLLQGLLPLHLAWLLPYRVGDCSGPLPGLTVGAGVCKVLGCSLPASLRADLIWSPSPVIHLTVLARETSGLQEMKQAIGFVLSPPILAWAPGM